MRSLWFFGRRGLLVLLAVAVCGAPVLPAVAAEPVVDKVHFLIPGGAGGGWDGTARGTGEALTNAGLLGSASYENMSGGGGGKAIAHLIETASEDSHVLMVNSTPIVIRSLQGVFPQNFRDLTPIAGTIGDYAALVVSEESALDDFSALVAAYEAAPNQVAIGGGSVPGSMDHLVAAMAFKAAGVDAKNVKYIPYDAGGDAMAGLLSGEIQVLSTGLSEALELQRQGAVRILAMTGETRIADAPDVPTLKEQGVDVAFVNWRGFFGPPGLDARRKRQYVAMFEEMYDTYEWEEVRARNGWINIYNPDGDFVRFLGEQEKVIGNLMRELGFL